jgi:uncharacterized protein
MSALERRQKVAVVTGASSGIGAATAVALGERGWTVVMVARTRSALEEVAARVQKAGGTPVLEVGDAADGRSVLEMAERIRRTVGVPEVIVNSAGAGSWRYIDETPPEEMVKMMGAPFFAAYNFTYAFMKDMLARKSGRIIHIGSPASALTYPGATGYTCARWALRGLHEALRQDLHGTGVTTSHLVVGPVETPYFEKHPGSQERLPWIANLLFRILKPEECAQAVMKLIQRPRAQVIIPFAVKLFYWTQAISPWLARYIPRITGHKRALPLAMAFGEPQTQSNPDQSAPFAPSVGPNAPESRRQHR